MGRKILRIAFAMLRDRKPYQDPDLDYDQLLAQRNQAHWVRALRKAGLLPLAGPGRGRCAWVPGGFQRRSGVSTSIAAVCATLSRLHGLPTGRNFPGCFFGISTCRTALGR